MREHPLFAATFGAIARFKAVLIPRVAVISRVSVQNLDAIYHENVIVFLAKPNSSSWWIFDRYRDRLRLDVGEGKATKANCPKCAIIPLDPSPRPARCSQHIASIRVNPAIYPVADLDLVAHVSPPAITMFENGS